MEIRLLMTGNELMSGVTVDSNSAFVAQRLETLNLRVATKVTIGDDIERIIAEMERLSRGSLLVSSRFPNSTTTRTTICGLPPPTGIPMACRPLLPMPSSMATM